MRVNSSWIYKKTKQCNNRYVYSAHENYTKWRLHNVRNRPPRLVTVMKWTQFMKMRMQLEPKRPFLRRYGSPSQRALQENFTTRRLVLGDG